MHSRRTSNNSETHNVQTRIKGEFFFSKMAAHEIRFTLQDGPYSIFQNVYRYREENLCSSNVASYIRTVHKANNMYF